MRLARWFVKILLLVALVYSLDSFAGPLGNFQLDEVSITYRDFHPGGHDPLLTQNGIPNREPGKYVAVVVNTTFMDYFYFNNLVHGASDQQRGGDSGGQFRSVGWNFQLGIRLIDGILDLEYSHHSQHVLDHASPQHFPVVDSIGIRLILFESNERRPGLL